MAKKKILKLEGLKFSISEAPATEKSDEILKASGGKWVYVVEDGLTKSVPTVRRYLSTGVTDAGNVRVLLYGHPQMLHKQLGRKFYFDLEELRAHLQKQVEEALATAQRRVVELTKLAYGWEPFEIHARPFIEPNYPKKLKLK